MKTCWNSTTGVETLESDASFKYCTGVVIIAFGPDDEVLKQNDAALFY